ncbi:hypothetical protein SJI00_22345, partial [Pseudomonas sp. RP23018S]|uniref:hypothetical protein n=1 Tax=Pseudomonas sp. RP23018S TaxID=3096037 RepID=UPI002ACA786C
HDNAPSAWAITLSVIFFLILISPGVYADIHRVNFAYRITHSGIEERKWESTSKLNSKIIDGLLIFLKVVIISIIATVPGPAKLALAGPGGMGLVALVMLRSKTSRDMRTRYHQNSYNWKEITQLSVAANKDIVNLKYNAVSDVHTPRSSLSILCRKNQKEAVATLVSSYLSPDAPSTMRKSAVPER